MKVVVTYRLFVIAILFVVSSCSSDIKFNKKYWNEKNGLGYYDNRENMINDVLTNYNFVGKEIQFLRHFFGQTPLHTYKDTIIVQYNIITDFGLDIDPIYTKDLMFYLNSDSTILRYNIVESN